MKITASALEFDRIGEALERDYAGNYKVYWHDDNLNNNALTPGNRKLSFTLTR